MNICAVIFHIYSFISLTLLAVGAAGAHRKHFLTLAHLSLISSDLTQERYRTDIPESLKHTCVDQYLLCSHFISQPMYRPL